MPRLALIRDYHEEGWPSMDLTGEMLVREINAASQYGFRTVEVCPPFRRLLTRLSLLQASRTAFNADRLLNRYWLYPRYLRRRADRFDLFHLCDHSYAQLLHVLPPERTGVYCHDLDTFQCVLEPDRQPRPRWFRLMTKRILDGMRKAAVVFHTTASVRELLLRHGLVDPAKLVHAPNGVAPEYVFDPCADSRPTQFPFVLHVGSCIPRKRVDVLLEVFGALSKVRPHLRLVQIGGDWTARHRDLIRRLGIADRVSQQRGLKRTELAEHYRQAELVLQPSEAEGFGLPVIEALACGAVVLASDIPALREVGGDAATYCSVGDVETWVGAARKLLEDSSSAPPLERRMAQAARFSWKAQADVIVSAYRRLLGD